MDRLKGALSGDLIIHGHRESFFFLFPRLSVTGTLFQTKLDVVSVPSWHKRADIFSWSNQTDPNQFLSASSISLPKLQSKA